MGNQDTMGLTIAWHGLVNATSDLFASYEDQTDFTDVAAIYQTHRVKGFKVTLMLATPVGNDDATFLATEVYSDPSEITGAWVGPTAGVYYLDYKMYPGRTTKISRYYKVKNSDKNAKETSGIND